MPACRCHRPPTATVFQRPNMYSTSVPHVAHLGDWTFAAEGVSHQTYANLTLTICHAVLPGAVLLMAMAPCDFWFFAAVYKCNQFECSIVKMNSEVKITQRMVFISIFLSRVECVSCKLLTAQSTLCCCNV